MQIIVSSSTPIILADYTAESLDIVIRSGIHATIIDRPVTAMHRVIACTIEPHAHLVYIYDQQTYADRALCQDITFKLEHTSNLACMILLTSSTDTIIRLSLALQGQYAYAKVRGLYALDKNQQVTVTTLQHHVAPHTTSDLIIKGLLNGSAQASYQGTILVDQNAKQTRALQENKNLLLSSNARAQSIPSLEVLTNDVQCKHGSAVGYLDEQMLFYAQSRGLSKKQAQRVMIRGFFAQVIEALPETMAPAIYKRVEDTVHNE